MSYSNTYTTLLTTVLKRYGIQYISFNTKDFSVLHYCSDNVDKFPMENKPTEEELDSIVTLLNEAAIKCESSEYEVSEDNC